MAGLTETGFAIKRLQEIKADLEGGFKVAFPGITVDADSVMGQIIGEVSKPIAEIWEMLELIYLSQYPASAEGFSLDNVAQYIGVVRLEATRTQAPAILIGDQGTLVLDGTLASVSGTTNLFEQVGDVTITKSNVLRVKVEISSVQNLATYTVTLDAVGYSYTSDAGATAQEIVTGLVSKINTTSPAQDYLTATDNGDETFSILVDDLETSFSADVDAKMAFAEIATPALYECQDTGPILATAGTLTIIETPVSGLDAINNLQDAVLGRNLETDTELRLRRRQSLNVLAAATVEAIKARILQEVDSVIGVTIFENRESIVVSGRPPHSFECVVSGGTDQDIGNKIWAIKPAGIQTFGNVAVNVIDSQGDTQVMYFSRATNKYSWVRVTITLDPEYDFPADGLDQIKNNILAYGETFVPGQNMIIQKFFAPVYYVPGIAMALVEIAVTAAPMDVPTYGTVNIPIGEIEIAVFDLTRISATAV